MLVERFRLLAVVAVFSLGAAMTTDAATRIERKPFGKTPAGESVELFTLAREGAPTVAVTNLGGHIVSILAPDKAGHAADVALGYKDFAGYLGDKNYFGCVVGRYANRIAKGALHARRQELQPRRQQRPELAPRRADRLPEAGVGAEGGERTRRRHPRADVREQGRGGGLPRHAHREGRLLAAARTTGSSSTTRRPPTRRRSST